MGLGAVLEPLVVVTLLAGGVLVNRDRTRDLNYLAGGRKAGTVKRLAARLLRMKTVDDEDVYSLESGARFGGGSSRASSSSSDDVAGSGSWTTAANDKERGSLLDADGTSHIPLQRERTLRLFGWQTTVATPNTEVFRDRAISRLLRRYPFLVEAWYWALIYWVCM